MNAERVRVQVTHLFRANAERVFDAFLDPTKAGQFMFATPTGEMVHIAIDPRVGGQFNFTDRRDGEDVVHTGQYLVIERPRRLVFTLHVAKYAQEIDQVEIDIVPLAVGCQLTLTHGMSAAWKDRQGLIESGWSGILRGLEETISRKAAALAFLQLVAAGQIQAAYEKYISPTFRHHNAYFAGDRASLLQGMEASQAKFPQKVLAVQHVVEEGDYVVLHSHLKRTPDDLGVVVVHLCRFNGDVIEELWDVGQPIPEGCVNENGVV